MREFSFGQYYNGQSTIHSLDPRIKIVSTIAFIVGVFLVKEFSGFIVPIIFLAICYALAKIPLGVILKTLKPVIILVLFTAILNLFFYSSGEVVFKLWFIEIRDKAIEFCLFMALRLILLVLGSSVMTLTTQPVELSDALESLLTPLKWVKFPVHELALIMSIALRFIPTLSSEAQRIIKAQTARGADFESGNLITRARALIPILIPLLVSSFRRADELADAMDARCYSGGENRTKYKKYELKINDFTALIAIASMTVFIVAINMLAV